MGGAKILLSPVAIDNPARAKNCARGEVAMLAQQGAQMLPFVLPVENSSAKKGRACAQCIGEAAGGARRVCGASNVKKNHDTLVECRKQKCVCAVQCVIRVSCGERFTRHMLGVDAGRAAGSNELVDYRASLWVRPGMPRPAATGVAAHSASVPMGPTCTPSRYLPPPTLLPPPNFER